MEEKKKGKDLKRVEDGVSAEGLRGRVGEQNEGGKK